jgi:hypothetical protein
MNHMKTQLRTLRERFLSRPRHQAVRDDQADRSAVTVSQSMSQARLAGSIRTEIRDGFSEAQVKWLRELGRQRPTSARDV